MARDDFPSRVKDQLARRVNHRCSNPHCRAPTSGPQIASAASMSVGVAAHISAASMLGPRFDPALQSRDRRSADNGIWLCQICAKLVDNDKAKFTAPLLREWKRRTEEEAAEQIGKPASRLASVRVLDSIHGQLRTESNARFGFSFVHPSVWDRQDPTNGDGNTYRHSQDSRIKLNAWGQYAVVSPDLHSWVDWTIECLRGENGFCLLSRAPAGGHLVDWVGLGRNKPLMSRQQVEGCRIVYNTEQNGQPVTTTQTFLQFSNIQVGLCCEAPSVSYGYYEELFLVISKKLRILGVNSAPFAWASKVDRGKST
jgi:hypothetical protein